MLIKLYNPESGDISVCDLSLLRKFAPAPEKNESFLIAEALNRKLNKTHGYKNDDDSRATATTWRLTYVDYFPL